MSGMNWRLVMVVTSFCLKSPPICVALKVMSGNLVGTSATTLSLRPPDQYQSDRFLLSPLEALSPDEHPTPVAPTATPAMPSRPA